MRKDRVKAEALRRRGKSYKFIHRKLGIPIATIAEWFQREAWSIEIRDRLAKEASLANPNRSKLMAAATRKKFALLHEEYRREAIVEYGLLKYDMLFISGVMLYWGEGDRKIENAIIRVSNSDPALIRVFYIFLVNVMHIPAEKIIFSLLLYPDLIDSVQRNLWSTATGIPLSQFRKSIVIQGRHPTKRLSYGVGIIRVGSRKHKEKLLKWIELYARELGGRIIA